MTDTIKYPSTVSFTGWLLGIQPNTNNTYQDPIIWLNDIYNFVTVSNDDAAIELLFDNIDDLLIDHKIDRSGVISSDRKGPHSLKHLLSNQMPANYEKLELSENVKTYCNLHLDLLQLRNNENLTIWDILTFHEDHDTIFNKLDEIAKTFDKIDYLFIITFMQITLDHTYTRVRHNGSMADTEQ